MRWDVRFSEIVPERDTVDTAVRFTYVRRSPVHDVHGTGVSIGERRRPDGSRTSALRFSTADPLSPIRTGRGYWRYVPTEDGRTRFITGYDHASGWGPLAEEQDTVDHTDGDRAPEPRSRCAAVQPAASEPVRAHGEDRGPEEHRERGHRNGEQHAPHPPRELHHQSLPDGLAPCRRRGRAERRMDGMDIDAVAAALIERADGFGQAVVRTGASTPVGTLRAAVRRTARARGLSIRTGMIDDVLAVVRTDAPLWEAPTSEMRRALAAPDEPGIVA